MTSADLAAQGEDLPFDGHLHTDQSPDSNVPIDRYAEQAVARRISELAITDHVDFVPGTPAFAFASFADRERVVRDAAGRWAARGVTIRFGVEVTFDTAHEEEIRDHLRRHPYDFVIGSVHVYASSPFHASRIGPWASGRSLAETVAPYFDEVLAAIRSRLFDTIGHLDFVKRYLMPHVTPADLAAAPELYEPLLTALVDTGTALEVNTSGLRQIAGETYPAAPIVARYRELGGARVSTGSDAHRADAFASGLDAGYGIVADAGFGELAVRRGATTAPIQVPERFVAKQGPRQTAGAPRAARSE
ncbi:MAG TPA: histidinol-phosphatase HisJ family protein [Candidatus Limnocylindrales bacterium]|nr:histidinol-phosphatase HisJ family protein [Candidatus Limnocylindrales bacterium]